MNALDENARRASPGAAASPMRTPRVAAALALTLLASCAVGPDFKRPAAPQIAGYTSAALQATVAAPGVAGGNAQRFAAGRDIAADWWTLFHCKALDDLIERSLESNPDLKAAQAALSAARENFLAQRGAYFPHVSGAFSASRQRQSDLLAPVPNYPTVSSEFQFNLFTPQVSVSYVPDVFGLNRRTAESSKAQEQAVRFQMIAAYTTLTANVVVAAIQEGAVRMQIDATRELIDGNSRMLRILRYQFAKGYASRLDVAAQESQLAQVAATLPPLLKQRSQLHDLLAALTGRFPNQAPAERFTLSSLQLPAELPVSLPSKLVAQRPDVRQAEANMHAASAAIGIAIANRLPNIELTADAGSTALAIDQVFSSGTGFWSLGGALTAPIFQGGTLLHQERAAKAAYLEAAEQYRGTVLTAVQNVADTLNALQQDATGLRAAATAAAAAKVTLNLSRRQLHDGYSGYLSLLGAEQSYQLARINLVQAQANRYADTAALFQALGGGWWHRKDLAED
ncbi:MAG TPA: efflux transporter outer membrane subunit [Steroidobacteraceae bacterium]|nr:efflux transporter outer membrane subunit [Steroidobacteraceae bacterium]